MTPSDHDTDPTPTRGSPSDTTAPPLGPPPRIEMTPRAKRGTVSTVGAACGRFVVNVIKKLDAGRVAAALMLAFITLMTFWTTKIGNQATSAADVAVEAKGAAEVATAQGVTGAKVAVTAKVENQAGYVATADKVDSASADMQKLVERVNALEAELARLKPKPRRRKPLALSPKTTEPLPPTPAAAAKEAAAPPAP